MEGWPDLMNRLRLPPLNLKAKLVLFIVVLLALTLGAEAAVSLRTQSAVVDALRRNVGDLANAIQIGVQELTAVSSTDRDRLQKYVGGPPDRKLAVSIASSEDLIVDSSDPRLIGQAPQLIGAALNPASKHMIRTERVGRDEPANPGLTGTIAASSHSIKGTPVIAARVPVVVEDHLMGYVYVEAQLGDFNYLLRENRVRLITLASVIFAVGIVFSYALADRYVEPIHEIAAAARNIAARGLEPVPEANRRDEIGLLTRSFNEMLSQLRHAREREAEFNRLERFTALGQLAGGLAHEIKNPLNFISLAVDQLRARYGSQITQDHDSFMRQIGMMKEEIRRLSELIQNFLHYGRPIEIHPAPTDLRAVVRDVLALSESKLRSQAIEVIEEGLESPPILNVDGEKIRTCFVNVVANATQAMPDGGELRIGFAHNDSQLLVTFSDTGAGIDPEVAGHVFEPFFTTKREGIGIGLFLSRAIVESHGGTIEIGPNQAGRGTVVTFTFPLGGIHKHS